LLETCREVKNQKQRLEKKKAFRISEAEEHEGGAENTRAPQAKRPVADNGLADAGQKRGAPRVKAANGFDRNTKSTKESGAL